MRIFIVDDEKNIRRALTLPLESLEHEVMCPANSALALAELKTRTYDEVLLDLRLSQEIGLEEIEAEHMRRVLVNTRTLDEAAAMPEIDPATLYRKRKKSYVLRGPKASCKMQPHCIENRAVCTIRAEGDGQAMKRKMLYSNMLRMA